MQIGFVAGGGLDGVGEGMAEVQDCAQILLAFVLGDHCRLDFARSRDAVSERVDVAREQLGHVVVQPVEQQRIPDAAVLDHFGEPGSEFPVRERGQRVRVRDDRQGLMKRTDQILAARVIDSGLAADRRVDLREQRRGDLHVAHAPLVAGRREARNVADHPAPQGQYRGIAIHFLGDQRIEHPSGGLQRLVLLAVRQYALGDPLRGEGVRQFREVQLRDGGIGHDQQIPAADARFEQLAVRQQP